MEEINKNIFTEYCKLGNNHNLEFTFFCKTHNELCCEKCISKKEEKDFGQHKNCDICSLEIIKEQKETNFKENLKNLKKISSNFEEIIKELNKDIDKANEEKENIKLNIQKLFTKIRNTLNKREDELFLSIDNIYEYINTKEILSRESEKLLNKSKLLLKTGDKYNEWNNTKKLSSIINVFISLENTIKGINSIKEEISKSNTQNNLEIYFEQNINIDKFIDSFNNIGLLKKTENANKDEDKDKDNISQNHKPKISFEQVDGKLIQISCGKYGVWGVNSYNHIYYRNMVSINNKGGINWLKVDGLLKNISSGENGVWGVNSKDEIFYRKGITNSNPTGNGWGMIDGSLKQISSGKYGVYGVNYNDEIWLRDGISNSNPGGVKWISIDGRLKYISAGNFGVWGVNSNNEVWLRKGVDIFNHAGYGWIKIEGKFKKVCCGEFSVLAINDNNEVFYRKGVTQSCFEGESLGKIGYLF